MYFSAGLAGTSHLWRQRFPKGKPEQITFGPTEESGVVVSPDGGSLVTSVGIDQGALWIHDAEGEHEMTSEGSTVAERAMPSFSLDGKHLYYLSRHDSSSSSSELWRVDMESGKSEELVIGLCEDDSASKFVSNPAALANRDLPAR